MQDDMTAPGADETVLDPWGSASIEDYQKLFDEFGIEPFEEVLPEVPNPHYLMRRGVIFGHRDYPRVLEALRENEPFAALSGFMPTGEPHIGHKLVFDELVWHQRQGGEVFGLVADLEAHSARGRSWTEVDRYARDYILSFLASGFDPEEGTIYRQSTNREVQDLGFELGIDANFSELQALYGFDGETDVSHMQSVITQMADILYPQLLHGPLPTVIPVGPDQDPHVRLSRDLGARTRFFGVTEAFASFEADEDERAVIARAFEAREQYAKEPEVLRCIEAANWLAETEEFTGPLVASAIEKLENAGKEPLEPRVRITVRNATESAFEELIEEVEGEKRVYDLHVDCFDLSRDEARSLARQIELDHGGFGFILPSSIYHRFMTGLTGGKMSSSIPASHISLLDEPVEAALKVESATTGGRETAELQRELGGRADECPVYELYAYILAADDDDLAETVYEECVTGARLCGECKAQAAGLMHDFLEEHQARRDEWAERIDDLEFDFVSERPGPSD